MTFKVGVTLLRHHVAIFPNTHSLLEIYILLHYIHGFGITLTYSNVLKQILKCRFKCKDRAVLCHTHTLDYMCISNSQLVFSSV